MSMMQKPVLTRGLLAVRADVSDPKAAIAELNKAWEAFKAANEQDVAALKKGQQDVVKAAEVDKINAAVESLQKVVDEQATRLAALQMGGGGEKGPVDAEYTEAFKAYFKRETVSAALTKGNDADGGYLAPVEWNRRILDRLVTLSPMRDIAQVQEIGGAGFRYLVNTTGFGSGWVGETAARPQTSTGQLAPLDFTTGEIYANPAASQQMLDDSLIDLEEWIASQVQTEFALQEGIAFVAGDGVNKPRGFLTYAAGGTAAAVHPAGAIPVTTVASATAITGDDLLDLVYALPQALSQNARFVMNRNVLASARKLKDTTGAYLWQPSMQQGQPSSLLGYPITEMAAMPTPAANALPVAFGDFQRGYLIVDRMGIRVLRDAYTNKPFVHFYTTKRVGGGVIDPNAIRILKMAAA